MARPDDIVAYTYSADMYCPPCVIEVMVAEREAAPAARFMSVEEALDQIASANAIDREDEASYDSGEFPKVVFRDQLEVGDNCGACGRYIEDE